MTGLSPEIIQALLNADKKKEVRSGINLVCPGCNCRYNGGYCDSRSCSEYRYLGLDTTDCSSCGHCANPNRCVASVVCPECNAAESTQCVQGNRMVAYHEARWQIVKTQYGVYYK